ncbi:MAG: rsmE [Actinomycetia bacterium]|nr:rsmE [Actinomycetes bacterium]MDQ1656520.1 rRNA (uracil1498-N3)-methyltransferase [Cryptosporangiaceae bacterium]
MSDPVFLVSELPSGDSFVLDGPEGRHAAVVRRLAAGESLLLADGRGGTATCQVAATGKDSLRLAVLGRAQQPAPEPRVTVVQALPKGDRGELAVELMTEAGIDEIVPWQAARCVTRWREGRGEKSLARWRSAAREAAKQSRRAWVPVVADPVGTAAVAALLAGAGVGLVLHEEASVPLSSVPLPRGEGSVLLVVGPEGGISPDELAEFAAAGARSVRLGESVLRTSTAGVAAAAVVFAATGRW